ncbi:MAG TPA: HXXEE domain-containing protein [Capillimicrobium sp.]|nr:HXXEE domain-containing protein [Capillimicrobium sp.]
MAVDTHGRWPWASAALVAPTWGGALRARRWLGEDGHWVAWLALPILVAHQTEEWVRPGGFLPFANQRLLGAREPAWPLTERVGFVVNVPLGWGTAIGGALLWERTPALAAGVLAIEAGNALMHGGMAVRERRYNPGAVTGPLLMGTHAAAGAAWLARSGRMTRRSTATALALGAAFTLGMPLALKRRMRRARR